MQKKDIQEQLEELKKRVEVLEGTIANPESEELLKPTSNKKMSIREFLISKKPVGDVQKTLVIGYYLEKYEKTSSFNVDDLKAAYERAREKKPSNMNDKVNLNIKKGHMAETTTNKDSKKSWYVTNSGSEYVESELGVQEK